MIGKENWQIKGVRIDFFSVQAYTRLLCKCDGEGVPIPDECECVVNIHEFCGRPRKLMWSH